MSASNAFRSHLMQQFTALARTQSRPPLALAASNSQHRKSTSLLGGKDRNDKPLTLHKVDGETKSPTRTSQQDVITPVDQELQQLLTIEATTATRKMNVDKELSHLPEFVNHGNDAEGATQDEVSSVLSSFQSFLLSRRTISDLRYARPDFLKLSLDRAILCGQNAPNHKHTEPTFFKRILSPSSAIDALADIVYHVTYRKKLENDPDNAERFASRKRDRWSRIPAYLVVAIKNQPSQCNGNEELYNELPFVAPQSESQLEDYAAACAATQNILLSLHEEGIGSKWSTGPIIKTPAFRSLIGVTPTDRVVGLIMVGSIGFVPKPPRRRLTWHELLEDL